MTKKIIAGVFCTLLLLSDARAVTVSSARTVAVVANGFVIAASIVDTGSADTHVLSGFYVLGFRFVLARLLL